MTDVSLLRSLRQSNKYAEIIKLGENMVLLTPSNPELYEELCIAYWHMGRKRESYDCLDKITLLRPISSDLIERCISNKLFFEEIHEKEKWTYPQTSSNIRNPVVTVTITSCKRLPLFLRTIDSFTRCCVDKHLIKEYICVDDNSSEQDRNEMLKYNFIRFIFKDPSDKGHVKSMQILVNEVKTPYMLHLEDDWLFFDRVSISDMIEIMKNEANIQQVAINKNYATCPKRILGGEEKRTAGNLRYFLHEHCVTEQEKTDFVKKHGLGQSCNYWPHFTLQPSIINTEIFKNIQFERAPFFEMVFAEKFAKKGYKTAFVQGITTRHIGYDDSAYSLNNDTR